MTAEISMVDTRVDMNLWRFSGRDEDWSDWCLRVEACGALLECDIWKDAAAVHATPITLVSLGDAARGISECSHDVL